MIELERGRDGEGAERKAYICVQREGVPANMYVVRNLQKLMTKIYKSINHFNPSLVGEFHEKKHVTYGLRIQNLCKLPKIKTQGYGKESLPFRGSFLWNTLDDTIKNQPTLTAVRKRIKDWACDKCTCKICHYLFFLLY